MSEPEQRACRRIDLEISVDLESEHNFFSGVASNMSVGGLFIATRDPGDSRKIGDLVTVRLTLPGDERPVTVDAVVRWIRAGEPAGMGVQFLGLSPDAHASISRFVRSREPIHR
ncbi:MAG TPA: TIGR02266 family protein [Polyangia bacterium]|nr:TIGR02266 family protein [Polyangia bacterium]